MIRDFLDYFCGEFTTSCDETSTCLSVAVSQLHLCLVRSLEVFHKFSAVVMWTNNLYILYIYCSVAVFLPNLIPRPLPLLLLRSENNKLKLHHFTGRILNLEQESNKCAVTVWIVLCMWSFRLA